MSDSDDSDHQRQMQQKRDDEDLAAGGKSKFDELMKAACHIKGEQLA